MRRRDMEDSLWLIHKKVKPEPEQHRADVLARLYTLLKVLATALVLHLSRPGHGRVLPFSLMVSYLSLRCHDSSMLGVLMLSATWALR